LSEATAEEKLQNLVKNYLDFGLKEKNLIKVLMLKMSPSDLQITKHIIQLRERIADLIQPEIDEMFSKKKTSQKLTADY